MSPAHARLRTRRAVFDNFITTPPIGDFWDNAKMKSGAVASCAAHQTCLTRIGVLFGRINIASECGLRQRFLLPATLAIILRLHTKGVPIPLPAERGIISIPS